MLVLLPPSEGKSAGGAGPAVDPGGLALPGLREARERVLAELVELCRGDEDKALEVLGLGPTQRGEIVTRSIAARCCSKRAWQAP